MGGHVDGDGQLVVLTVQNCPSRPVQASPLQHPPPDLADHPGLLSERDRRLRTDDPEGGVRPAEQRLDSDHPAVGRRHDRLVLGAQLLTADRVGQGATEVDPMGVAGLRTKVNDRMPRSAAALDLVHGRVRVTEHQLGDEQLVTDVVTVGVVHRLELVQVHEQDRHRLRRSAAPQDCVLEPLHDQCPIRQPGERVVQRVLLGPLRRLLQVDAGLGVLQVRGRHVGQGLRSRHLAGVHRPGGRPVQVECAEPVVPLPQREGEDRDQPASRARDAKVGNRVSSRRSGTATASPVSYASMHGPSPRSVCSRFEPQRGLTGRRDVAGHRPGRSA